MLQLDFARPARFPCELSARRQILVINGHPDPRPERFCAALCDAYEDGARRGGWDVRRLDVGSLSLGASDFETDTGQDAAVAKILWARRLTIVYPLWLDQPPEIVRTLFAKVQQRKPRGPGSAPLPGRAVITMEMPAFAHRALMGEGGEIGRRIAIPGLEVRSPSFIGAVNLIPADERRTWLCRMHTFGMAGR
jgi:putative NADPH-quinone reductase